MPTQKQFFNALKQFFNISSKVVKGHTDSVPFPGAGEDAKKSKNGKLPPAKFPDELQTLYEFWLKDTYDTSKTMENRIDRYNSLQYAYYNSPIVSATIDLYADEATQIDSQSKIVEVDAKDKKVQKWIQEFFDEAGITQKLLRDVAWNISLYGDAFWTVSSSVSKGIVEVIPIDPFSVQERLEFNAIEMKKRLSKNKGGFKNFISKNNTLQVLQKMMDETTEDISQYFKSYLFGFQVEKQMLPPWNVLHFRAFTTQSEFYPFGRPVLINSLAPFRQLQASKNLMALGRANSFTLKHFEVQTDENATWEDKWEAVNEARQQYINLGNDPSGKEQFTVNSEIWTPQDLLRVDTIESRFEADKISDVEMLRDDLIMGTRIPKGYLIVDRASFGTSGQALLAQHKPFARAVYSIQSAILDQLNHLVKLQMVMTGQFDPEDTEFQLKMAFPQTEESRDRVSIKNDLLRLTKDVIDNLGGALGLDRGEALPPDVVKQIFSQLSFLDGEDIDSWVDATVEMQNPEEEEKENNDGTDLFNRKFIRGDRLQKIQERLGDNPSILQDCIYSACKRRDMSEGVLNQKHFYFSYESDKINKQTLEVMMKVSKPVKGLKD